jgi:murein DD-endopeptidase MepM/ murein hydrolase activator NlpD
MKRDHFLVILAHPVYGRLRRIRVPHYAAHVALSVAVLAAIAGIGFASSYGRLLTKASEFNHLRAEKDALQKRYDELRAHVEERDTQLASLGDLASEVSIAFGIKRDFDGPAADGETVQAAAYDPRRQYDFLQAMRLPSRDGGTMLSWLSNTTPSIWPVEGRISSSFGRRIDPFHGRGAFHAGIDLSTPKGTAVVATADGTVVEAGWANGYGKAVKITHGRNGISTLYAHLTDVFAVPGQVVRRGEVIGRAGSTGRSTSSHLHYEVRYRNTPLNPYKYLQTGDSERVRGFALAD